MKAHISAKATIGDTIKEALLKAKQTGLEIGTHAVCKVIYDIATAESKDPEDRLKEITAFCEKGITTKTSEGNTNE